MNTSEAAERIGVPVEEWDDRCHEIAALCLVAGVTTGTLRYGLWHGPIAKQKVMAPRHHGWVEVKEDLTDTIGGSGACGICGDVEDEHRRQGIMSPCTVRDCDCPDFERVLEGALIFDPTRWCFEGAEPYLYQDHDRSGFYDVAGDRQREQLAGLPCPESVVAGKPVKLRLSTSAALAVLGIAGRDPLAQKHVAIVKGGLRLPRLLAGWLASRPLSWLGVFAGELYESLDALGLEAAVPKDCREFALGDGFYGKKAAYEARIAKLRAERRRQASA